MRKRDEETIYYACGSIKMGEATIRRVNKNMAYLCRVKIYPQYRGHGLYKHLRKQAKEHAIRLGYLGWIFTVRPDNYQHYCRIVERFGPPLNEPDLCHHVAGLWHESFRVGADGG